MLIQFKINANVSKLGFWYLQMFFLIRYECITIKVIRIMLFQKEKVEEL